MVSGACCAPTHKSLLLSRALKFWRQPIPQPTRIQLHKCSSLHPHPFNSTPIFNRSAPIINQLRFHNSRLPALSNDGTGGPGGGSGGWNSGGDSGSDDGGDKWSFLSWYYKYFWPVSLSTVCQMLCIVKKLEPMNTLASSVWWVFGFYWIVVGGQTLLEDSPSLLVNNGLSSL